MSRERVQAVIRDFRTLYSVGTTAGLTDGQLLERFATHRDEAAELAFAALVERHSPMVLRTCRGVLRDEHDARDALQATFLILARRGGALWVRDSLGPWLHTVACRVAVRSKRAADRRKAAERDASERAVRGKAGRDPDDVATVLHEEIERLPNRFRVPIVLCDLEGHTHEDAARHLRCPVGTVKSRLARGRERLRGRLIRRGVAPSVAALGAALSAEAASRELPEAALLDAISRAASQVAMGTRTAASAFSASSLALANAVSWSLTLKKLKGAIAILLATAMICAGMGRAAGWRLGVPRILGSTFTHGAGRTKTPSGKIVENRIVPAFDEIHVAEGMKVLVTVGAGYRVTATGDAEVLRDLGTRVETKPKLGRLATKTKLGRLLLDLANPKDGSQVADAADTPKGVEVRITVPRLNGVIAEENATIEVSGLKDQSFSVQIFDNAKVVVIGTGNSLTAAIGDAGELDASRFDVEDAIVTALDQSLSVVHARRSLNLVASDDARVETVGTPLQINKSTSERSRLTHRDARIMGPVVDRLPRVDTVESDVPHELSRTNPGTSKPRP